MTIKSWLKEIIRTVIREEIKSTPLILSSRPPNEDDFYHPGTMWQDKDKIYVAKSAKVEWTLI